MYNVFDLLGVFCSAISWFCCMHGLLSAAYSSKMAHVKSLEREDELQIVKIFDPALREGMLINCSTGNKFLLCGTSFKPGAKSAFGNLVYELTWKSSLYNPSVRKLVNESSGLFTSLQKLSTEQNDFRSQIIKISRKYRSVIKACQTSLQESIESIADEQKKLEIENLYESFYKVELIWNICEILFLDIQPAGSVLIQLLDWIRWHFTGCDSNAEEVAESENPYLHPSYWDTIFSFVLQGRNVDAHKILRLHPQFNSDSFSSLSELLKKMPMYPFGGNQTVPDFENRWHHWHEECQRRLDHGHFGLNSNLEKVCRILCGQLEAFEEVKDLCETWYHMLVSQCLYRNPTVKPMDLYHIANDCIEIYGGSNKMNALDRIILLAFEFNILEMIKDICDLFDNWWFVSHLTDILDHTGSLEKSRQSGITIREFLLLEYVSCLMTHSSLWQVGVVYLDHCSLYGRQHLELYLERIPLDTEFKANKVLFIANQRNMEDVVRSVCITMGQKSLLNNQLGSAMTWALHSKDSVFASFVADKFLREYCVSGHFNNVQLLDNLGPSMLICERLTFLGKYREFQLHYENSDLPAAAEILVSLLTSRIAPKYFWMTLLVDALPLLEADEVVISSELTYDLMYHMEELTSKASEVYVKYDLNDPRCQKESLIRLALARNLARALIHEGTLS